MPELSALQQQKAALERDHTSLVEGIHELRQRARRRSLEASSTRQPLPETEIQYWKTNIAKHQAELMAVQGKIAAVNKELRKAKPIRSLSQLPREVVGKEEPAGSNGADIQAPGDLKEGHILFLQFFRQLVVENIDPRMVKVLERDAHNLVNDHRRMHGGGSQ